MPLQRLELVHDALDPPIHQLRLRFGPLDEATEARLAAATSDQLLRWAERVIDADSVEDVLAD